MADMRAPALQVVHSPLKADYAQAIVARGVDLVFTSGQGPFDREGHIVAIGDFEAQIRKAYQNLGEVLESAGASFETVIRQTVYLSRADDYPVYREVRKEIFGGPPLAMTAVRCDLLMKDMLVEIDAIAAVGIPRTESA